MHEVVACVDCNQAISCVNANLLFVHPGIVWVVRLLQRGNSPPVFCPVLPNALIGDKEWI